MKKELITFDQLAALSFLKFVKLNEFDMTLLMREISDIAEVEVKDDSSEYFIMSDGSVKLEKSYIDRFNGNVDIELFESIRGNAVKKYLDNLNMLEFVLRKIKLMGPGLVIKDELDSNFSFLQINMMNLLYQEGYIVDYLHEESSYDDNYQAVKLTKRGELYLYLIDYQNEIEEFSNLLKGNGYDKLLLKAFLITQDLEKMPKDILTLENFMYFCDEYDKCPERNCGYRRVRVPEKK